MAYARRCSRRISKPSEKEDRLAPPIFVEPRCSICAGAFAGHRLWIENLLVKGRSDKSIAESFPPLNGETLSRKTVGNHKKNHMKLDQAVIRATLEQEADKIQQNFEEGVAGAVTDRGIVKVLIMKAYESALADITVVEVKDLIQLIKLSQEFEAGNSDLQYQEAANAVALFKAAIKAVLQSGDFVSREVGTQILAAIQDEVRVMRSREDIAFSNESTLELPDDH